jgi:hypothetical protein
MPPTPYRLHYLRSSAWSKQLTFKGSCNSHHTENHYTWLVFKHWTVYTTRRTLRGNVAGIPTTQNPDIPEGLESQLLVGIHRIPAELPHSIELELRKLHRARMDYGRASTLELLWELLTSREVLRPSEPHLSLLYKNELGSSIGG